MIIYSNHCVVSVNVDYWSWFKTHHVLSNSLCPHGLLSTRLLCQWNFSDKNTGMGCHFLFQGIFLDLVAQTVKKPPAMRDTWIWSLGWDDPLEKEIAIHSSILAWRIPWTEEPGRPQSMGLQRLWHDLATNTFPFFHGGSVGKESACLRSDP